MDPDRATASRHAEQVQGFNVVSGGSVRCPACQAQLQRVERRCPACGAELDAQSLRIERGEGARRPGPLARLLLALGLRR